MANQESQLITDLTSTPIKKHQSIDVESRVRTAIATVALTDAAATDVIRFVRVPSRARVEDVELVNDQIDSNGTPTLTVDVGLYATNGGAAVNDNVFSSGNTSLHTASNTFVDVLDNVAAADRAKQLWDLLGDSSDPGESYDVALTVDTAAATFSAGNVTLRVRYTLPE